MLSFYLLLQSKTDFQSVNLANQLVAEKKIRNTLKTNLYILYYIDYQ